MNEQETGPHLRDLFCLFRPPEDMPQYEVIAADAIPEPERGLLAHEHHMTVTVEAFYQDLVDVRILERYHEGDVYARKILLALHKTGRVVQFGIVRVNLSFVSPEVRDEIVAGQTPFGRILIKHNVLRRIEPTTYLRIVPGPEMMKWFALDRPQPVYGRLAYIHCDGVRAVELIEVVAPTA